MSRSDAFIIVTCDECRGAEEIQLTAIAGGGYDERNVDDVLENMGWKVFGSYELCEECSKEACPHGHVDWDDCPDCCH